MTIITLTKGDEFRSKMTDATMNTKTTGCVPNIAVPAAMKIAVPNANAGIFLPMALAVTFPFNITLGMPIYFAIVGS